MFVQVLIYEDNAAGFSMVFDDDGEQFRHVIGESFRTCCMRVSDPRSLGVD